MLADEAKLVVERRNGIQATEAVLTRDAISAVLSKKGADQFKKVLKGLTEG